MNVKVEHLTKFLKTKLKKGVYGSVHVSIQDGNVLNVSFQETFNSVSFVQHAEQLPNHYRVSTYGVGGKQPVSETVQNEQKTVQNEQKSVQNVQDGAENVTNETDNDS
jgi:hypothetical protein